MVIRRAKRGNEFLQVIDASARTKRGIRQGEGLSRLNANDVQMLTAAESGDVTEVKKLLEEGLVTGIVPDELGRTPLQLAVNNSQNDVVVALLGIHGREDIRQALKDAIRLDNESTAEAIIRHPKYEKAFPNLSGKIKAKKEKDEEVEEKRWDALEMSPLEMAAQMEHFGIVQLLLIRGQTIQTPHEYSCMCDGCVQNFERDPHQLAKSRLETYKALASQAYVSLAVVDPIDYAFDLGKQLRQLSQLEKHYRSEYLQLADNLSDYVAKLLDQVNTNFELDSILNKTGQPNEEKYAKLKRLEKAINLEEKKFVSHASVVKKLDNVWYDDLRRFEDRTIIFLLISFFWIVAYPALAVFYWFAPETKYAKLMRIPYLKFLGYVCMFTYFILIIFLHVYLDTVISFGTISEEVKAEYLKLFPGQKGLRNRNAMASGEGVLYIMVAIFVAGMLWQEIKQLYAYGLKEFVDDSSNLLDWIMLNLYVTSLTLYFVQYWKSTQLGSRVLDPRDDLYGAYDDSSHPNQKLAVEYWYWNIPDRHMWEPFDPMIVSEGLFSFANILAFFRITYFMRVIEVLGPMQISLGRITSDVGRFMVIFVLIFVAFIVGLQNLYYYYSEGHRTHVERYAPNTTEGNAVPAMIGFGGFVPTLQTLFWSLFGMVEPGEVVPVKDGADGYPNHDFTEYTGYIIFGLYNVVMVIILLNMFIAMMTQSYESVSGSSDVEWKFARASLYMDFITPGSTLAFPFNIVPSFKALYYLVTGKYCGWKNCKKLTDVELAMMEFQLQSRSGSQISMTLGRMTGDRSATGGVLADREGTKYQDVMWNLIKRFVLQRETEADIAEGEMDEIKNDISSLRYQLVNQLNDQMSQATRSNEALTDVTMTVGNIEQRMGIVEQDLGTINIRLEDIKHILEKVSQPGQTSAGGPAQAGTFAAAASAIAAQAKIKAAGGTAPPPPPTPAALAAEKQ